MADTPYQNRFDLIRAPRARWFSGSGADTWDDRTRTRGERLYVESTFTQSNARIWLGQSANGTLRLVAMPTRVYPAATARAEFAFGPGMYYASDMVTFLGDVSFALVLDDGRRFDLDAKEQACQSWYADHFLPLTSGGAGEVGYLLTSLAPVAPDADRSALCPAPLPGPAGCIYSLALKNGGGKPVGGRVVVRAKKRLIHRYEDLTDPVALSANKIDTRFRENSILLVAPYGCAGLHFDRGAWDDINADVVTASRAFTLEPGGEESFDFYVAMGKTYGDIMPALYALYGQRPLAWLNKTASFWRERLGSLAVGADGYSQEAGVSRDIFIRCLFDNFNCVQLDENGNLLSHMQGAPSHRYGTVWGIDVEPTAVSLLWLCPQMARQILLFFATRSYVPIDDHAADFSVPILVAPVILARKYLETTGDFLFFRDHPEIMPVLEKIARDVLALRRGGCALFPTRFSSDGATGKRYDYAANVKVWYAFDCMDYLEKTLNLPQDSIWCDVCARIREAVHSQMEKRTEIGAQVTGGTNLTEDPAGFYLPEEVCYYDGEDTASMLAPIYGFTDFDDEAWRNYHRFARTLFCKTYDPEFDTLLWTPSEPLAIDGTGFVSRLGGSVTRREMADAMRHMKRLGIDDTLGSLFWWPSGYAEKRGTTRCSQGQGAWAWQYAQQWLGVRADAAKRELVFAPLGLLSEIDWRGLRVGESSFDVFYMENAQDGAVFFSLANPNAQAWTVRVGVRGENAGAQGASSLIWHTLAVPAGQTGVLNETMGAPVEETSFTQSCAAQIEAQALADGQGVLFCRYGGASFKDSIHFERDTAPLELRFVALNATGSDWTNATVTLTLPAGVSGGSREAGCREIRRLPPYAQGEIVCDLGALANNTRKVAAFSVERPVMKQYVRVCAMHAESQPGKDIALFVNGLEAPVAQEYAARLHAKNARGEEIERAIIVCLTVKDSKDTREVLLDD